MPDPSILSDAQAEDARATPEEILFGLRFLKNYYFPDRDMGAISHAEFVTALKTFQSLYAIEPTGILDARSVRAMLAPRCAMPDTQAMRAGDGRWHKTKLKLFVAKYVAGIPNSVQEDILVTAYRHWSDVANISFDLIRTQDGADIVITTGRGRRSGFDGAGSTLAWAELPPGDDRTLTLAFDLDESWSQQLGAGAREILLENVACHEGGHTLGLDHSIQSKALMAPYYNPQIAKPQPVDDVPRIQAIYGERTAPAPTPVPPSVARKITLEFTGSITKADLPGWVTTRIGP
jgi:hypothetical protein